MKKILRVVLLIISLGMLLSFNEKEKGAESIFKMKAKIENIGEKIEVDAYEGEYASGLYWLIVVSHTEFVGKDGEKISLSDLSSGDRIEVTYNGQVMMSYPAQIVALKIQKL